MSRATIVFCALAAAAVAAVGASAAPKALAGVSGGMWELDGLPGHKAPARQCFADPLKIAAVEHGHAKCTETVLSEKGDTLKIGYQCAGGGFGQAVMKVITPRSLRVDVQGIADGGPYAYVLQAHHVGECGPGGAAPGKPERGAR